MIYHIVVGLMTGFSQIWVEAGAHNEEEGGRERSTKCPRSKLKFQIFLTVVELLNLDLCAGARAACATILYYAILY